MVLDKYSIVEARRTFMVYNWLQYFSRQSLVEELQKNRFQVVEYYADVVGTDYSEAAGEIAIVAQKL